MPTAMFPEGEQLLEAMNVRVVGSGERVVVLAHGFGSNQSMWEGVLPALTHSCKVVLYDLPGSSTTDPNDFHFSFFDSYHAYAQALLAMLDELQVDTCTYVGHSMSGMIGCIASVMQPRVFEELVLLAASPRYLNDGEYYGGFEQEDLDQLFNAIATDFQGWAASFAPVVVGVNDPDAVERFSELLSSMRHDVAYAMAKTIFESDHRSVLPHVRTKTHILQTAKDLAVPGVVADFMQRHLGTAVADNISEQVCGHHHGPISDISSGRNYDDNAAGRKDGPPPNAPSLEVLPTEGHLPQLTAPHLLSSSLRRILLLPDAPAPDSHPCTIDSLF